MGVFTDLIDGLERDIATVHGQALPIEWRYDPRAPVAIRWTATVMGLGGCGKGIASCEGASGEDPLRRLSEKYARLALLEKEKRAATKGKKSR